MFQVFLLILLFYLLQLNKGWFIRLEKMIEDLKRRIRKTWNMRPFIRSPTLDSSFIIYTFYYHLLPQLLWPSVTNQISWQLKLDLIGRSCGGRRPKKMVDEGVEVVPEGKSRGTHASLLPSVTFCHLFCLTSSLIVYIFIKLQSLWYVIEVYDEDVGLIR